MGLQDRHYGRYNADRDGGGGGFRRALRRMFLEGDNFFAWSLPLFTIAAVRVRIHLIFVLMIIAELIGSAVRTDTIGIAYTAYALASLFVLVLLHEFGHIIACRRVGGEADEILMWPLGGLAMCAPPRSWRANLITTIGGPGVNVLLIPILGGAMIATGIPAEAVLLNPFSPGRALAIYHIASTPERLAFWLYYTNLILLLFNLIPMFPLDGGRILQELLWRRLGYERATHIAANIGLFLAVGLGIIAMLNQQGALLAVAIFAGFTCVSERRAIRFMSGGDGYAEPAWSASAHRAAAESSAADEARYRRAAKEQERQRQQQAEVDAILAKIARSGMDSLSRHERKALQRATEERRKQAG